MDRASDSGSEGWGFESLPVYQKRGCLLASSFLVHRKDGLERTAPACRLGQKVSSGHFLVRGRVHVQMTVASMAGGICSSYKILFDAPKRVFVAGRTICIEFLEQKKM